MIFSSIISDLSTRLSITIRSRMTILSRDWTRPLQTLMPKSMSRPTGQPRRIMNTPSPLPIWSKGWLMRPTGQPRLTKHTPWLSPVLMPESRLLKHLMMSIPSLTRRPAILSRTKPLPRRSIPNRISWKLVLISPSKAMSLVQQVEVVSVLR